MLIPSNPSAQVLESSLLSMLADGLVVDSNDPVANELEQSYNDFAANHIWIQSDKGQLEKLKRKPAQIDLERQIDELRAEGIRFFLVVKSRQLGVTTDRTAYTSYRAWTEPIRAMFMAHDADTTAKMRRMAKLMYDELDDGIKARVVRNTDNAAITSYLPHHSEITIATAGAERGTKRGGKGRGGTYNIFHGSEVALWPNPGSVIAGALQGLAPDGICVFETTTNGAVGWVFQMAMNPTAAWAVLFYAWWWDTERYWSELDIGELIEYTRDEQNTISIAASEGFELQPEQIKWKRDKIAEMGVEAYLFDQEYPETLESAFLTTGKSAFQDFSHALYSLEEEPQEYDPTHTYIGAMDWGISNDYTVLCIWDVTANREVYIGRWRRMRWDGMIALALDECKRWGVCKLYPEANSMSMQVQTLRDIRDTRKMEMEVLSVTITPKSKRMLVGELYNYIHREDGKLIDNSYATSELRTFVSKQTDSGYTYAAIDGAHDDTVMTRCIAAYGRARTL